MHMTRGCAHVVSNISMVSHPAIQDDFLTGDEYVVIILLGHGYQDRNDSITATANHSSSGLFSYPFSLSLYIYTEWVDYILMHAAEHFGTILSILIVAYSKRAITEIRFLTSLSLIRNRE
jgi:hypothetical protein